MAAASGSILALDVGNVRIGLAEASRLARIAQPLGFITNDESAVSHIHEICMRDGADTIVVGLPRGLSGQDTKQTEIVREFARKLEEATSITIYWQDEAVTSLQAEQELKKRKRPYQKGDIDSLAAVYILEDYIHEHL